MPLLWQKSNAFTLISAVAMKTFHNAYLEELEYVVSNVVVDELWIEASEIGIVDIFEY
jgi:hypothetical protein